MKNGFLIFTMVMLMVGVSQGQDYQWVIKEGEGVTRNGSSGTYNDLDFALPFLKFVNFSHPSSSFPNSRNDIFIIYEDGNFYNSYDAGSLSWNGQNGNDYFIDNDPAITPINYLYWTNRYEGDDLTNAQVVVENSNSITQEIINIGYVTGDYFNVNHDIVPYRDFTVIIKREDWQCFDYVLHYNTCNTGDCTGLLKNSDLSDVVLKLITPSSGILTETPLYFNTQGCSFVNFKVDYTSHVDQLVRTSAKMNLYLSRTAKNCDESQKIAALPSGIEVPVLFSHDPNFIKLDSICTKTLADGSKDYFLHFYGQVQNTGTNPAVVNLKLPLSTECDPSQVFIKKLYYNGGEISLSTTGVNFAIDNGKLLVDFPAGTPLLAINALNPLSSIAAVEFCVKIKEDQEQAGTGNFSLTAMLFPTEPKSYFDGVEYPINTLIDVFKRNLTYDCDCGDGTPVPSISNPPTVSCPFYYLRCNGTINWWMLFGAVSIILATVFLVRSRRP